jgi:hypothetical protein
MIAAVLVLATSATLSYGGWLRLREADETAA